MARIELEHVFFAGDGIFTPGPNATRQKKLRNSADTDNRLRETQHFHLWFEDGFVYVQHPKTGDTEEVPLASVTSWKRARVAVAAKKVG
jgi:predicted transcriptional regulator